jgi:hypothetical protein
MLIAITTNNILEIHQIDVRISFLNADLDKKIEQFEGFIVSEQEKKVYKFVKLLYGLK